MTDTKQATSNPERWRVRRGTKGDDYHACPPSDCMILDTADHGACAYIVVRMDRETEDRKNMLARAELIASAPLLRDLLKAARSALEMSQNQLTREQQQLCVQIDDELARHGVRFTD